MWSVCPSGVRKRHRGWRSNARARRTVGLSPDTAILPYLHITIPYHTIAYPASPYEAQRTVGMSPDTAGGTVGSKKVSSGPGEVAQYALPSSACMCACVCVAGWCGWGRRGSESVGSGCGRTRPCTLDGLPASSVGKSAGSGAAARGGGRGRVGGELASFVPLIDSPPRYLTPPVSTKARLVRHSNRCRADAAGEAEADELRAHRRDVAEQRRRRDLESTDGCYS